jgi:hypothetical protein
VADRHVVVFGEEADRGADVRIGEGRAREVEQFPALLVADCAEPRPQPLEDLT